MTVQRLDAIFNTVIGYLPNLRKETDIPQKDGQLRIECICYKILFLFLLMALSIIFSFHFIISVFLIRCLVIGSAAAGVSALLFPKRAGIFVPVSVILVSFALGQASMVLARERKKPKSIPSMLTERKQAKRSHNISHTDFKTKHATNVACGDIGPKYASHQSMS